MKNPILRQSIYKLESCGINEIFKHSISGGYPICAEHNGKLFFCYSKECAKFDPSVTPISDAFTPIARVAHPGMPLIIFFEVYSIF